MTDNRLHDQHDFAHTCPGPFQDPLVLPGEDRHQRSYIVEWAIEAVHSVGLHLCTSESRVHIDVIGYCNILWDQLTKMNIFFGWAKGMGLAVCPHPSK